MFYIIVYSRTGPAAFKSEASNLLSKLEIGDDILDIEDVHSMCLLHDYEMGFPLRGIEFSHVIVCVTQLPNSFTDKDKLTAISEEMRNKEFRRTLRLIQRFLRQNIIDWQLYRAPDLMEAISRALIGVTIVYTEGDLFLSQIAEQFKGVSPEICQNCAYSKTNNREELFIQHDASWTKRRIQSFILYKKDSYIPSDQRSTRDWENLLLNIQDGQCVFGTFAVAQGSTKQIKRTNNCFS